MTFWFDQACDTLLQKLLAENDRPIQLHLQFLTPNDTQRLKKFYWLYRALVARGVAFTLVLPPGNPYLPPDL